MKQFYYLLLLILTCGQYSCVLAPQDTVRAVLDAQSNSTKGAGVDTLIPPPKGWTNDFVDLFSDKEVQSLDSLIGDYEKKTSVEFSVATIDARMLGPMKFEAYTLRMMNTWGVGKKGKNNGILIVIAPDIRKVRIENGYGIEKMISDEGTKEVIDKAMVPHFKEGRYFEGTKAAIIAMMNQLK